MLYGVSTLQSAAFDLGLQIRDICDDLQAEKLDGVRGD